MRTLIYVTKEGRLVYRFHGGGPPLDLRARSGPWGKGAAPRGLYGVGKPKVIDAVPENSPYTDPEGFAWFARLEPMFKTDRSGFGLHPDGNVSGTRGCIGVEGKDTRPFFDYLKSEVEAGEPVLLYVV